VGQGAVLSNLGLLMQEQGSMDAAWDYYQRSLASHRQAPTPNQSLIGTVLNNLGFVCNEQGRYAESRAFHEESLAIRRRIGDTGGIGLSLMNLGGNYQRRGDYAQAREHYVESLRELESIGDLQTGAHALNSLGWVALEQGDYAEARAYFDAALKRHQSSNDTPGEAATTINLSYLAMMEGQLDTAADYLATAEATLAELEAEIRMLDVYLCRGRLAYAQGDQAAAWDATLLLLRRAREVNMAPLLIEGADMAALLLAARGDRDGAARAWAAVNAERAARSMPRTPSQERWNAQYAAEWLDLIGQTAADAEALDQVIERLEQRPAGEA
jgi:tetratricopeptide (TPR) repeat protein